MAGLLDLIQGNTQQTPWAEQPYTPTPSPIGNFLKKRYQEVTTPQPVKPMTQQEAMDFALMGGTTKILGKAPFEEALKLAQKRAALPVSEGGLGLPANNTAMERAKALGFDTENPLYHGTKSDFNAFQEGRKSTYLTDEPRIADIYANSKNHEFYNSNAEPNVIPVFTKNNILNVSDLKNGEHGWMHDNLAELLNLPLQRGLYKEAENQGYDVVKVNNMTDLGGEQTQYIVPSPKNIRSINAAFDPFRRNEADILAGVGVIPTAGLLDEKKKKKTTNK